MAVLALSLLFAGNLDAERNGSGREHHMAIIMTDSAAYLAPRRLLHACLGVQHLLPHAEARMMCLLLLAGVWPRACMVGRVGVGPWRCCRGLLAA